MEFSNHAKERDSSSVTQAFFNFIKSLVGIAILDLPFAANKGGYLLSCLSFIFISYGTIRTTLFLIDIANQTDLHSYSKLVKVIKGKFESKILDVALVGQQLFSCIAYIIFFQFTSERALSHLQLEINPLLNLVFSLLLILPLSLIRDMHFFSSTSTIGFLLALFTLITISILSFSYVGQVEATPIKFSGIFGFVGVAMFAYEGICTALPVRFSMKNNKEFSNVLLISTFSGLILYVIFIVINCIAYGDTTKQIIFFNLPETNLTFILQFIYAISILLTYPVQIHPAFEILEKRFTKKGSRYQWLLLRIMVTLCLYMIAYYIPNFSTLLNLIGVIFGTVLQFWFPITMRLKQEEMNLWQKSESYALLAFGALTGILGFRQAVMDMVQEYQL